MTTTHSLSPLSRPSSSFPSLLLVCASPTFKFRIPCSFPETSLILSFILRHRHSNLQCSSASISIPSSPTTSFMFLDRVVSHHSVSLVLPLSRFSSCGLVVPSLATFSSVLWLVAACLLDSSIHHFSLGFPSYPTLSWTQIHVLVLRLWTRHAPRLVLSFDFELDTLRVSSSGVHPMAILCARVLAIRLCLRLAAFTVLPRLGLSHFLRSLAFWILASFPWTFVPLLWGPLFLFLCPPISTLPATPKRGQEWSPSLSHFPIVTIYPSRSSCNAYIFAHRSLIDPTILGPNDHDDRIMSQSSLGSIDLHLLLVCSDNHIAQQVHPRPVHTSNHSRWTIILPGNCNHDRSHHQTNRGTHRSALPFKSFPHHHPIDNHLIDVL